MKLSHLTDKILLHEMISLVQRERVLLAEILWRLKEIDRRKLYSDMKCGSLFEYCVKILKYSEGQASRRVTACRLLRDLPELSGDIKSGAINLTQLNQAKHFFDEVGQTPFEKRKTISEIRGKTVRETEKILWEKKDPQFPQKVSVSLQRNTLEALHRLKALKAHSCKDLDDLLMKMTELVQKEWDPTVVKRQRAIGKGESRFIQIGVKAKVWEQSQGKCANCSSVYALELDHIQPFSMGGRTKVDNLRLLCRNCNQRRGQKAFSRTYYQK